MKRAPYWLVLARDDGDNLAWTGEGWTFHQPLARRYTSPVLARLVVMREQRKGWDAFVTRVGPRPEVDAFPDARSALRELERELVGLREVAAEARAYLERFDPEKAATALAVGHWRRLVYALARLDDEHDEHDEAEGEQA